MLAEAHSNHKSSGQFLLNIVSDWLQWSGMVAKIPKCQCLALQAPTGKLVDPHLSLNGVPIPFSADPVRFLGMQVQVPRNESSAREAVLSRLQAMLTSIDETPLTRKQKLLLYSGGVCPRLTWPLLIQECPTTWMDRQVDSLVTRYLKKWSGLGRSGNVRSSLVPAPVSRGPEPSPSLHSPQEAPGFPPVSIPHFTGLQGRIEGGGFGG